MTMNDYKEILEKQLPLLIEDSKKVSGHELAEVSQAIVSIIYSLTNHKENFKED